MEEMKKLTLFSTPKERHSFVIGFSEAICFFIKTRLPTQTSNYNPIYSEEHYYTSGRAAGVLFYVIIILIIIFKVLGW